MSFSIYIISALALVLVIEGLLYALFPTGVRKMMAMAISMPEMSLRKTGGVMVIIGFLILMFLQSSIQSDAGG